MTGYEILRHHARALEPWRETPRTQIYPKLRELQRRGLIEHEYVVQESKPNKRLYAIGRAGPRPWPVGWAAPSTCRRCGTT